MKLVTFKKVLAVEQFKPLRLAGLFSNGLEGSPYSSSISILNGAQPYSNPRVLSGAAPDGLTLSVASDKLLLSGSPTVDNSFFGRYAVDSADGQTASIDQTIKILALPGSWLEAYDMAGGTPVFAYEFDNNLNDSSGNGFTASPSAAMSYSNDDPAPLGGNCVNITSGRTGTMSATANVSGNTSFVLIGIVKVPTNGFGNCILWMGGGDNGGVAAASMSFWGNGTNPQLCCDFNRAWLSVPIDVKYVNQWMICTIEYTSGVGVKMYVGGIGDASMAMVGSVSKSLSIIRGQSALFNWAGTTRYFIGKSAFCGMKSGTISDNDRQLFLDMLNAGA